MGDDRRRSRLRLKAAPNISFGLVLGPWAGLTAMWALMLLGAIVQGGGLTAAPLLPLAFAYVYIVIFGVVVCLVIEAVTVVPLLIGFQRYRWPWLNGWTGALFGFGLAFGLALLCGVLPPATDFSQVGQTVLVLHGQRTAAGWVDVLTSSLMVGVVGLVAAVVFRAVAVEVDPDTDRAAEAAP